jgi:hypothetical protein
MKLRGPRGQIGDKPVLEIRTASCLHDILDPSQSNKVPCRCIVSYLDDQLHGYRCQQRNHSEWERFV